MRTGRRPPLSGEGSDNRRLLVFICDLGLKVVRRLTECVDAQYEGIRSVLGARKTAQLKELLETFLEAQPDGN